MGELKSESIGEPEHTRIEVLILANHAEAINGLLYLSGGGWSDTHRQIRGGQVPSNHFGIGMSIRVPWHETNESHKFAISVENDDASLTIAHAEGEINVGRPPQLPRGAVQHAVLAVNVDVTFPSPGGYRVIANVDEGKSAATWPFRVHDERMPAVQMGTTL